MDRLLPAWARAALILLAVAAAARWVTWGNPAVGFDEQYYLLVGDRLFHGALPYVDVWDRKPVGLFLIFAAIRGAGGDGVLHYQLAAGLVAVATALAIHQVARRGTGRRGALAAGIAYLLWLNLVEGEGGQAPVFFNLPMILAAALTLRHLRAPSRRSAAAAMLLAGVALQIKYSVVFEGAFFGMALLWADWRRGARTKSLAGSAAVLAGIALLPTLAAAAFYWWAGALDTFVFANFLSIFGKSGGSIADKALGWLLALAVTGPLWIAAALASRGRGAAGATTTLDARASASPSRSEHSAGAEMHRRFLHGWLVAAIVGLVPFVNGPNPSALAPALLPLCLLAAPALERGRRATPALLLAIFAVGQVVLALNTRVKGNAAQARALAAAAMPRHGCLFVYDGYPALYHLTKSCLPTRYAFPGLLNTRSEDDAAALSVDPAAEVARILATRPDKIADVRPVFPGGNPRTRALVEAALARDYRPYLEVRTGPKRRIIYIRR